MNRTSGNACYETPQSPATLAAQSTAKPSRNIETLEQHSRHKEFASLRIPLKRSHYKGV
jgi:hypothetical protein